MVPFACCRSHSLSFHHKLLINDCQEHLSKLSRFPGNSIWIWGPCLQLTSTPTGVFRSHEAGCYKWNSAIPCRCTSISPNPWVLGFWHATKRITVKSKQLRNSNNSKETSWLPPPWCCIFPSRTAYSWPQGDGGLQRDHVQRKHRKKGAWTSSSKGFLPLIKLCWTPTSARATFQKNSGPSVLKC